MGDPADTNPFPRSLQVIERYLEARRVRLSALSVEAYGRDLEAFADHLAGDGRAILEATEEDVARWLAEHTRDEGDPDDPRPWSRRTAKRKLSTLNGFFRWAVRADLIEKNPAVHVDTAPIQRWRPPRLDRRDVQAIFDHIEWRIASDTGRTREIHVLDHLILTLCYRLGLRIGEACGLRRSAIRAYGDELRVEIRKKGGKVREYPLVGEVRRSYDRWMGLRRDVACEPGHDPFLLVHPWTGKRTGRRRAWNRVRAAAEGAGLPAELIEHLSPHKLRHAIAYHLVDDGVPLPDVQALLDHASLSTTDHYVQADEKRRLDVLRRASAP